MPQNTVLIYMNIRASRLASGRGRPSRHEYASLGLRDVVRSHNTLLIFRRIACAEHHAACAAETHEGSDVAYSSGHGFLVLWMVLVTTGGRPERLERALL